MMPEDTVSLVGAALTSPASPQQQLRPVVSRVREASPLSLLCSFLTSQIFSHASHQTVARDLSLDVLRVLLTFELWDRRRGMVKCLSLVHTSPG